jgi:hypothetical protein
MHAPATAPWSIPITSSDFAKLKAGFEPQDQDDKWCYTAIPNGSSGTEGQSSSPNISVHIVRVGTRVEHYILIIKPPGNHEDGMSSSSGGGAIIEAVTWEQDVGPGIIWVPEDLAKKECVLITKSVLGCDLEAMGEVDFSEVLNHPARQLGSQRPTAEP